MWARGLSLFLCHTLDCRRIFVHIISRPGRENRTKLQCGDPNISTRWLSPLTKPQLFKLLHVYKTSQVKNDKCAVIGHSFSNEETQCENKFSIQRRPVAGHKRLQRSSASSISAQGPLPQIALQKNRCAMIVDSLHHLFISWLNHPCSIFLSSLHHH